jgi:hypothetical protein
MLKTDEETIELAVPARAIADCPMAAQRLQIKGHAEKGW